MKVLKRIFIAIGMIPVLMVAFYLLQWSIVYIGALFNPNPQGPSIKYAEFPFRLEYKINDEYMVVEDTLICEYDGIEVDVAVGKYRKWKSYLASGNEKIVLQQTNSTFGFAAPSKKANLTIYYDSGPVWYYLGNPDGITYEYDFPNASFLDQYIGGGGSTYGVIYADELLDQYGIELISWEIAPPIENTFKSTERR